MLCREGGKRNQVLLEVSCWMYWCWLPGAVAGVFVVGRDLVCVLCLLVGRVVELR